MLQPNMIGQNEQDLQVQNNVSPQPSEEQAIKSDVISRLSKKLKHYNKLQKSQKKGGK